MSERKEAGRKGWLRWSRLSGFMCEGPSSAGCAGCFLSVLNFLISLVPSFLWCLDTVQELKEKALSRYNLVRVSVPSTPSSMCCFSSSPKPQTLHRLRPLSLLAPVQNVLFPQSSSFTILKF